MLYLACLGGFLIQPWVETWVNYEIEDSIVEVGVELKPIRKKNSKRKYPPWKAYLVNYYRKSVEAGRELD